MNTKQAPADSATVDQFAALLGIKCRHEKSAAWVQGRLAALGVGKDCTRCGGCGEYSSCAMYGTTCFKCGGTGKQAQSLTPQLYAAAQALVADGTNAAHVARLQDEARVKRLAASVMTAWSAASKVNAYRWRDACNAGFPLHRIAADFNARMCKAYECAEAARADAESATYSARKARTLEKQQAAQAALPALKLALAITVGASLAEIAAALADVEAWRATLSADELAELAAPR